jgi:protein SCO1/2
LALATICEPDGAWAMDWAKAGAVMISSANAASHLDRIIRLPSPPELTLPPSPLGIGPTPEGSHVTETAPPKPTLKRIRILLWLIVVLAIAGSAAIWFFHTAPVNPPQAQTKASIGGPFTLVGADGKPFPSSRLAGKPHAIYFGFTRCGDVCPTTLQRLVKLRREAASDQAMNIVFVTIDPKNDGPREVGQYATLFGAPIIGLTGSPSQIDAVKKQYGIYAEPVPHAAMGQSIAHSSVTLLFDRSGQFSGTITADEPDSSAIATLKQLTNS